MSEQSGHIELDRRVDSITIGTRHRRDTGDLDTLVDSIEMLGLLQPVTITPEGLLICGYRRLEAVKKLHWRTMKVWVRPGLSDDLNRLLAERDENVTHKPLAALEAARLYNEVKALLREDATRRQQATQFGAETNVSACQRGPAVSPAPRGHGDVRHQAAELVTKRASYSQLEHILEMERIAADRGRPVDVRQVAEEELERIGNGGAVDPGYQRVRAVDRAAAERIDPDDDFHEIAAEAQRRDKEARNRRILENRDRRLAALATAKRTTRSFTVLWAEMLGWTGRYDAEQLAADLKDDDWLLFQKVLDESTEFAREIEQLRGIAST